MTRHLFALAVAVSLAGGTPSSLAQADPEVVPGVVTADNVDVTADDGTLLSERLGVGDMVYLVLKPKNPKKGWVRLTRSVEDTVGIGWVEAKNVQRFREYRQTGGGAAASPAKSGPSDQRIAVLPFSTHNRSDPTAGNLTTHFSSALKARLRFQIVSNVPTSGIDLESVPALRGVLTAHRLDGIFVGKLSSPIGGSRILQIRFLGPGQDTFGLERVKRLPPNADVRREMRELADSCAAELSSR